MNSTILWATRLVLNLDNITHTQMALSTEAQVTLICGCGSSEEWHVNYVAGHNVSSCQRPLIRETGLGFHLTMSCFLVQLPGLGDKSI